VSVTLDDRGALVDAPGVYDLPEAAYHADPLRHLGGSLSSTTARKLLPPSCPALARHAADHPEHTIAYDLGSVTHRMVLGSGCEIVEVPADSWRTEAAKQARRAARDAGKVALLSRDLRAAQAMRDAVHADPIAHAVLTMPGAPERTLVWQEDVDGEPVWCRAMLDRWPEPTDDVMEVGPPPIVDLKKTGKGLSDEDLQRTIWGYGYHQQEDWYRRGYHAVHGVWPDFLFIFVSDALPHLVRVAQLDDRLRAIARDRNDEALAVWRACQQSGEWPAYQPTGEITLIGPPRWARTPEDY
jgi:hypothetical protein